MGTLQSIINHAGRIVNGVLLGDPAIMSDDPTVYAWDDAALPNGTINEDGDILITD